MKKILIASLLFFSLSAHSQIDSTNESSDTSQIWFNEPPDSTGFGTPDGQLVSKEIGPEGGSIVSDDGRVELIFPADALTTNTVISIQPTTNPAPNGSGKAYQFEPSGIQFKNPVKIIFHYSDEDAENGPQDLMGLAVQDHTGHWDFFDYDEWDSSGKKLTGEISHFSYVSKVNLLALKPKQSLLKVQGETEVVIWELLSKLKKKKKNRVAHLALDQSISSLAVNGVLDGDEKVGTVFRNKHTINEGESPSFTPDIRYKAPDMMPEGNPVTISLKIFLTGADEEYNKYLTDLRCKVEIYDQYTIDIEAKGASILMCGAQLLDYATFSVKLFAKKIKFGKIDNHTVTLTTQAKCKGCPFSYDPAGCPGPIHVNSAKLTKYEIRNYPPEVTIEFVPVTVKIMKSTGKCPEEIHEPLQPIDVNIGNLIQFIADRRRGTQKLTFGSGPDGYKVTLAPL